MGLAARAEGWKIRRSAEGPTKFSDKINLSPFLRLPRVLDRQGGVPKYFDS